MKLLLVPLSALIVFLSACSSSKQGKVKQGKDGKIESASIKAKCSPPQKSYAREIETKLKAEMDSLKLTPSVTFDASFNQKVIKLREYSSQGLDLDLLTFRICEMANNRGLTSEQTSSLIEKAIQLWKGEDKISFQQTIISNNQSGGITAGNIFVGQQQRRLVLDIERDMLSFLSEFVFDSLTVRTTLGDSEALTYSYEIKEFLSVMLKPKKILGVDQAIYNKPFRGIKVDTFGISKSKHIVIDIGTST